MKGVANTNQNSAGSSQVNKKQVVENYTNYSGYMLKLDQKVVNAQNNARLSSNGKKVSSIASQNQSKGAAPNVGARDSSSGLSRMAQ